MKAVAAISVAPRGGAAARPRAGHGAAGFDALLTGLDRQGEAPSTASPAGRQEAAGEPVDGARVEAERHPTARPRARARGAAEILPGYDAPMPETRPAQCPEPATPGTEPQAVATLPASTEGGEPASAGRAAGDTASVPNAAPGAVCETASLPVDFLLALPSPVDAAGRVQGGGGEVSAPPPDGTGEGAADGWTSPGMSNLAPRSAPGASDWEAAASAASGMPPASGPIEPSWEDGPRTSGGGLEADAAASTGSSQPPRSAGRVAAATGTNAALEAAKAALREALATGRATNEADDAGDAGAPPPPATDGTPRQGATVDWTPAPLSTGGEEMGQAESVAPDGATPDVPGVGFAAGGEATADAGKQTSEHGRQGGRDEAGMRLATGRSPSPSATPGASAAALGGFASAFDAAAASPALVTPSPRASGTSAALPGDTEMTRQVVRAVTLAWNDSVGEARMRLTPEHLGEVTVSLRVERGAVSAVLHAETPASRDWIRQHEEDLRQGLEQLGLRLDALVVTDERNPQRQHDQPPQSRPRRPPRTQAGRQFELTV